MYSDNEREGRALIQAWKNACDEVDVQYNSASRNLFIRGRGRITTLDDSRIVLSGLVLKVLSGGSCPADPSALGIASTDSGGEVAFALIGARWMPAGSKALFRELGLDPSKHAEMVDIHLGNMDRLTLAARGPSPVGFWRRLLRWPRQHASRFLKSTDI